MTWKRIRSSLPPIGHKVIVLGERTRGRRDITFGHSYEDEKGEVILTNESLGDFNSTHWDFIPDFEEDEK